MKALKQNSRAILGPSGTLRRVVGTGLPEFFPQARSRNITYKRRYIASHYKSTMQEQELLQSILKNSSELFSVYHTFKVNKGGFQKKKEKHKTFV